MFDAPLSPHRRPTSSQRDSDPAQQPADTQQPEPTHQSYEVTPPSSHVLRERQPLNGPIHNHVTSPRFARVSKTLSREPSPYRETPHTTGSHGFSSLGASPPGERQVLLPALNSEKRHIEGASFLRSLRLGLSKIFHSPLSILQSSRKTGRTFLPQPGLDSTKEVYSPIIDQQLQQKKGGSLSLAKATALWHQNWPIIFKTLAVLQWWFFNVLLILLNKWIYQVYRFNFPLTLTTIHFFVSFAGAFFCIKVLQLKPLATVSNHDLVYRVLPMAIVTNLNVCLGNVSLRFIPVTFMQTIKAFTPAVTVFIQAVFQGRKFDPWVYASLIPVVGGVTLASATELSFHLWGFIAAMTSTVFTSINSILAEVLLKGKVDMDSINTVYYMAPQNAAMLLPMAFTYEGPSAVTWLVDEPVPAGGQNFALALVFFSGILAFGLNFSLFYAIQATSAMTFNVAGNLKVALAILLGWLIFRNPMSYANAMGCTVTVLGCTLYGSVMSRMKVAGQGKVMTVSVSESAELTPEFPDNSGAEAPHEQSRLLQAEDHERDQTQSIVSEAKLPV